VLLGGGATLVALVPGAAATSAPAPVTTCPVTLPVIAMKRSQRVQRNKAPLIGGATLQAGDRIAIGRRAVLVTSFEGAGYRFSRSAFRLRCDAPDKKVDPAGPGTLALVLERGSVRVSAGGDQPRAAAFETADARVHALRSHTRFSVERDFRGRRTKTEVERGRVEVDSVAKRGWSTSGQPGPAIVTPRGGAPRPQTYPFAVSPDQRRVARNTMPTFWSDGRACSVGCRPGGAGNGWPLRPFRRPHALRAGLNELRPSNFHLGIDIQARDFQRVYAMQAGTAHIIKSSGIDERVQVGRYIYWHVGIRVGEGQQVHVHQLVGKVKRGFGHLHLSEVDSSDRYLNPLRPGGRVLKPWSDHLPPVLGAPRFKRGGRVVIEAFDPQSFEAKTTYWTPVLAPAALAYRLSTDGGHRIGPLHFALRGSQHLPDGLRHQVYARGAHKATFTCFRLRVICVPTWRYVLAGGLAPAVSRGSLGPGSYRLTAFAWDWAGNISARDLDFSVSRAQAGRAAARHSAAPTRPDRPLPPSPRARRRDRG
jgi:hypothetical protein